MLETLLDRTEGDPVRLGPELTRRYGGELRFPAKRPWVFANFVESIDGVVSLATPGAAQASVISARNPTDRFVLGLLRVPANAVVVGAGTLRGEPKSLWSPHQPVPELKTELAAARAAMGLPPSPLTVLITRSGDLDLSLPVFGTGERVLVLTTAKGEARLRERPPQVDVRVMATGSAREIVDLAVAESGGGLLLTEGGPNVFGQFLRERMVDELFLTIASRFAGRDERQRRLSLVENAAFAPDALREARLVSLKVAGDYLFTRYASR